MVNQWTFDNERWLKDASESKKILDYSIRSLAWKTAIQHSTLHRILTGIREPFMSEFIMINSFLKLEAVEYFDVDEIQLKMPL